MDDQTPASQTDYPNPPPDPTHEIENPDTDGLVTVGIGASAGGLEAFTELLKYLPKSTGLAFVLVQHLDPHHESALPELLASKTEMPVVQVQDQTPLEPDHIYVIPPNTLMQVRDRTLSLEVRPSHGEKFRPIDTFFSSLAKEFHSKSVGVVLSGTASDGTWGLKTIKAEGGLTFAQNETAKFDGMPRSAISAGVVDFILPPQRIAEELASIAHRDRHLRDSESQEGGADGTTLQRIFQLLRKQTGVDFTQYKLPTILRRLHRRMLVRDSPTREDYFELLRKEPGEVKSLFDDLLINVTDFFRDSEVFETAKRMAFPSMMRDREPSRTIRAWIAGCSSGEEVYSLAIALMEFLETEDLDCAIQMFGTDMSDAAIAKARAGVYHEASVLNVSPERLRRFFQRTETGYQINRSIREMCIFSQHNVAKDPPLSRMDLISCRNLLIYFSPVLQRHVISTFIYALQPSGCLILGPSETLGGLSEYFQTLDEPHKIYCRRTNRLPATFQLSGLGDQSLGLPALPQLIPPGVSRARGGRISRHVNQLVLAQYGPAGVVLDETLGIIEYRGDMSPYLITPLLEEGVDLIVAIREELRAPVTTAIEQARRADSAVVVEGTIRLAAAVTPVAITAVPISLAGTDRHFLILFQRPSENQDADNETEMAAGESAVETDLPSQLPIDQQNAALRQELKSTREYLQSVIEELRSVNEEAQSSNEELQSTNEELQTSKEELQSSNEELNTINAEMQSRNMELAELNDDLINLLASMNMPIIMTGRDLRIRRFTPVAKRVLRLIASDVGRPISDLKPRINVPDLEEILQQVLDTLQPHEQEVQDEDGRFYLMRVRPYRTTDNRIEGAVLQMVDVTELKHSLEEVSYARDYAEAIVNTVREPLMVLDDRFAIQTANRAFFDALRLTPPETQGQSVFEIALGQFNLPEVHRLLEQPNGGSQHGNELEIQLRTEQGEIRILSVSARRLLPPNRKRLTLMAFEDITDRKRAAEARYRRLFESARDGIVLVDANTGEIFDINPYIERLLGYSRSQLVGRKLWEAEAMANLPGMRSALQQIRDQSVLRFDDLLLRAAEGRDLHTEVIANVYWEGERQAVQFNIRDVSERKKFERELQETQKLESLGLLAGGIAHDFNNLLTGIMGNASLAYSELAADHPLRLRLRDIVHAGERAAFLTRQMLAYAGRGRFVTEAFDLGNLVREISALVRTSIAKTVDLELDLAPDLPHVEGDVSQVQQVIMNLVINGAEAIGENAGKVEIRTSRRDLEARETGELFRAEQLRPGLYVQLEISDTGSGMDETTKARIFDPFFTTKFTGRGLGLAAVQGIVKSHGGAIRVYSTPGHGTTFLILFPAKQRKPVAVRPDVPPALEIPAGSVALVVDDEETVRALVNRILGRAGMKVLTAENGKAGVELFREHHSLISVVILDLQMPVMGGEEALAILKEIDPDMPVILSSGFDESEARQRFAGLKASSFLQKPYTSERLVAAVAAALQRKA